MEILITSYRYLFHKIIRIKLRFFLSNKTLICEVLLYATLLTERGRLTHRAAFRDLGSRTRDWQLRRWQNHSMCVLPSASRRRARGRPPPGTPAAHRSPAGCPTVGQVHAPWEQLQRRREESESGVKQKFELFQLPTYIGR